MGTLVDGRYRLQGELGAGGMSEVHRALDEQTGEVASLKLLRTDRLGDESLAGLADGEARTGWYLNRRGILHPNIVRTLQIGRWRPPGGDRELPYLVMEHVAGPTLGEWMKGYGERLPDPARVFLEAGAPSASEGAADRLRPWATTPTPSGRCAMPAPA
ncbi:MAG: hypothetical protein GY856_26705 [bacterium]|nr:hypothetical protein [bacterium]